MNIFSLTGSIFFTLSLYLGLSIFLQNRQSNLNRLFLCMCASLSLWMFFSVFLYAAESRQSLLLWYKLSYCGLFTFGALNIHFITGITGLKRKIKYAVLAGVYVPAAFLMYAVLSGFVIYRNILSTGEMWVFDLDYNSLYVIIYLIYIEAYFLMWFLLLLRWRRSAETNKKRRQASVLLKAFLITYITGTLETLILPNIIGYRSYALSPLVAFIWIGGIWYAISKYELIHISPHMVSEEIMAHIDDPIILFDLKYRVTFANDKAETLLNINSNGKKNGLLKTTISDLILEHTILMNRIEKMREQGYESLLCRLHYKGADGSTIPMDTKLKVVKDRY